MIYITALPCILSPYTTPWYYYAQDHQNQNQHQLLGPTKLLTVCCLCGTQQASGSWWWWWWWWRQWWRVTHALLPILRTALLPNIY